ncbi:MAG: AzlD domain-containing protein [Clostridia bacterium]|nr:AzlD domain-containing protein [Clostridia bacterium]
MNQRLYAFFMVAVISLFTALLRFLPFWVFRGKRAVPPVIRYLGNVLPCAVIAMLVVYCLKDVSLVSLSGCVPVLLSVIAVILLHVWKRSTLLSIIGGTACYMVLIRLM